MAHTKQTPRNPNVDRPTAAMGSDIQPERRIPLKPTSKNLPIKGGKQPQKHLLHKVLRRNKSLTRGIKKPHRKLVISTWTSSFERNQKISTVH